MVKKTQKTAKTTKTQTLKQVIPAKATEYTGKPIEATRLYTRKMIEFKNTEAAVFMAINDDKNTVTYLNTYKGGILPASYNPETYTYILKEKVIAKKLVDMIEIERTEWPPFIVVSVSASAPKPKEKKIRVRLSK